MIAEIKETCPDKTIWLYTGFVWDSIKTLPFISQIDVLVDGPFQVDKLDVKLHWRGSSNQRVINVKETLRLGQMVLWSE